MRPIIQGAKLGLTECRYQFRHHHWNCSVLPMRHNSLDENYSISPPTTTSPTLPTPQARVLRENKNGNARKRKARNQQNGTSDNLNLGGRDFYSEGPTLKSKKKNRKHSSPPGNMEESSTNNNFVMGGMTKTSSGGKRGQNILQDAPALHLHHHDKEEKGNWNSMMTRGMVPTYNLTCFLFMPSVSNS